jgi:putative NADH-flavin reductase
MRLTIFGATGATGMELVRQGLAQGHQLTCLVRNPATAKLPGEVTQVRGDARDAATVAQALAESDAVLSALGSRSLGKSDLLDRGIANILEGMKQHGLRRLIVLGAAGAVPGAGKYQSRASRLLIEIIRHTLLKYPFLDQAAQEHRLAASDVDYTIVRPPRLTNGPYTGHYRVESDGLPRAEKSIARADVADFMLKQLHDQKFVRAGVYISR